MSDNRIWKYTLKVTGLQQVEMPSGSRILSVDVQDRELCVWALVSPQNSPEKRTFEIIGTGNPVTERSDTTRRFIGTVLMPPFVWHVFELTELGLHERKDFQ